MSRYIQIKPSFADIMDSGGYEYIKPRSVRKEDLKNWTATRTFINANKATIEAAYEERGIEAACAIVFDAGFVAGFLGEAYDSIVYY